MKSADMRRRTGMDPARRAPFNPVEFWGRNPIGPKAKADPLTGDVLDLFRECDRIDNLPDDEERERALETLMAYVRNFEAGVPAETKAEVLQEALEIEA